MATATERRSEQLAGSETGEHFVDIAFYQQQQEFVDSEEFITAFCAGRGSGKSWVSATRTYLKSKPNRNYMVVAPDYAQLMTTMWEMFLQVGQETGLLLNATKSSNPPKMFIRPTPGGVATVQFRSGDDPERLRGPNLSGAILEEASVMHPDVIDIVLMCLREGGERGYLDLVFTPKGKLHWTYELLFDELGNLREGVRLIRARSEDNPFLDRELVRNARLRYTTALAAQELDGEFVDLAGLLFKREWFEIVKPESVPIRAHRVRYWDKAATVGGGDYSAGVLMAYHEGTFWVEDVIRGQWSPKVRNEIMRIAAANDAVRYRGTVKIWVEQEPGSGGKESAILSIHNLAGYPVWTEPVRGVQHRTKDKIKIPGAAKIVRAQPLAAQAEHGNVKVVSAKWNRDWFDEILAFPEASHDDQVDATAGAFAKLALSQPATKEKPTSVASLKETPRSMQFDRRGGGMFGRR